jgi:hypothetical protein
VDFRQGRVSQLSGEALDKSGHGGSKRDVSCESG